MSCYYWNNLWAFLFYDYVTVTSHIISQAFVGEGIEKQSFL